jgi:hypothetical protein
VVRQGGNRLVPGKNEEEEELSVLLILIPPNLEGFTLTVFCMHEKEAFLCKLYLFSIM